jgi:D-alanyl-lipoteichoic acid acyltransferase DltB (MBOAT superfamily)
LVAYAADIYAMHLTRPWIDNQFNPLWINVIWNGLAVLGVELSMILYRGYKAVTLSHAEKADKDRTFN